MTPAQKMAKARKLLDGCHDDMHEAYKLIDEACHPDLKHKAYDWAHDMMFNWLKLRNTTEGDAFRVDGLRAES